jgi:hypothetical protein
VRRMRRANLGEMMAQIEVLHRVHGLDPWDMTATGWEHKPEI